jgi:hypothetical protein
MASRLIRVVSRSSEADLGGVEEQAHHGSEDDQVEQHLDAHDDAGKIGPGCDVAESDS